MGVRKSFRLRCDFCGEKGPEAASEALAVRAGASCPKRIVRVFRSFYGNEVWACADCLATNDEAKEWAREEDDDGRDPE